MRRVHPYLPPKCSSLTSENPKPAFPFLVFWYGEGALICLVALIPAVKIIEQHLRPLGPSTFVTSSSSSSIPPPLCWLGFVNHVVWLLRRLCSLASDYAASAGPHSKPSAVTIDWLLPSFLPSTPRFFFILLSRICSILA
jgi:hypothetical protein